VQLSSALAAPLLRFRCQVLVKLRQLTIKIGVTQLCLIQTKMSPFDLATGEEDKNPLEGLQSSFSRGSLTFPSIYVTNFPPFYLKYREHAQHAAQDLGGSSPPFLIQDVNDLPFSPA
jgi:hypothetical protein